MAFPNFLDLSTRRPHIFSGNNGDNRSLSPMRFGESLITGKSDGASKGTARRLEESPEESRPNTVGSRSPQAPLSIARAMSFRATERRVQCLVKSSVSFRASFASLLR